MLKCLPQNVKLQVDAHLRKPEFFVPENKQNRDWLIATLMFIRDLSDPQFSWLASPSAQKICRNYSTTGECTYGDKCKFAHIPPVKPPDASLATATGDKIIPEKDRTDLVDVTCGLQNSEGCVKTFQIKTLLKLICL